MSVPFIPKMQHSGELCRKMMDILRLALLMAAGCLWQCWASYLDTTKEELFLLVLLVKNPSLKHSKRFVLTSHWLGICHMSIHSPARVTRPPSLAQTNPISPPGARAVPTSEAHGFVEKVILNKTGALMRRQGKWIGDNQTVVSTILSKGILHYYMKNLLISNWMLYFLLEFPAPSRLSGQFLDTSFWRKSSEGWFFFRHIWKNLWLESLGKNCGWELKGVNLAMVE